MAAGKGKKKNAAGTQPRKTTKSPAAKVGKTGKAGGPKKSARGTTSRAGEK